MEKITVSKERAMEIYGKVIDNYEPEYLVEEETLEEVYVEFGTDTYMFDVVVKTGWWLHPDGDYRNYPSDIVEFKNAVYYDTEKGIEYEALIAA